MVAHDFVADDPHLKGNERRTLLVVVLTAATMIIEIVAGHLTGSMALLADGWHMASHAAALFISYVTYRLAQSTSAHQRFTFGTGKFIPLGGYTSALLLGGIALLMIVESIERLRMPVEINFNEAIFVAIFGLAINLASAAILYHEHHHDHDHGHAHDHNLMSAYMHVLADALTSLLAIGALLAGKYFHIVRLDAMVGIIGAAVILKWAYGLCKATAWELLDGHAKTVDQDELRQLLESKGITVADLHVWRIAPRATACEIVVSSGRRQGHEYYRNLLLGRFDIAHLVVEERDRT